MAVDGGGQVAGDQPDPALAAHAVAGAGGVDGHVGLPGHVQQLFAGKGGNRERLALLKNEGNIEHDVSFRFWISALLLCSVYPAQGRLSMITNSYKGLQTAGMFGGTPCRRQENFIEIH